MERVLIIEDCHLCNLLCEHCQGAERALTGNFLLTPPISLPAEITLEELREAMNDFKARGLLGAGKITAIRFGGGWSEPTLDSQLPEKIKLFLNETEAENCLIEPITNGITIPDGNYDEAKIGDWFEHCFGFRELTTRLNITISVDEEHLQSYQRRRAIEAGISPQKAAQEYSQKLANICQYAKDKNIIHNIIFNFVVPISSGSVAFEKITREKFGISYGFRVDLLRKSIYTIAQETNKDAMSLVPTGESPANREDCFFMRKSLKHRGQILLYPTIADFGYDKNGVPYNEFSPK